MLTIALSFLGNFFNKYKKYIIGIIALVLLVWWIYSLLNKIEYLQEEGNRKDQNIENMSFDVKETKLKNGQLQYTVNSLTLRGGELEHFSSDIFKRLNEMDLKIKNIKSVTNIDYNYTTNIGDTLKSKMINKNKFLIAYNKNNLDFSGFINIPEGYPNFEIPEDFAKVDSTKYPYMSNLSVTFSDTLLIVPEIKYKRRWIFWKKATGVEMHIKSENPNFKLNKIQTYEFKN
jgi:hypothetical protein